MCLEVSKATKLKLRQCAAVPEVPLDMTFIDVSKELLKNAKPLQYLPVAVYVRLPLPELIPEQYKKVLYLDSDLLIRKDIRSLCEMEMGDNHWRSFGIRWNTLVTQLPTVEAWNASRESNRRLAECEFDSLRADPSIVHFAGIRKPWLTGYRPGFQAEWIKNLRVCGWFTPTDFVRWYAVWLVALLWRSMVRRVLRRAD